MWFVLLACAPQPPDITTFDATCSDAAECEVVFTDVDTCSCSCDTAALSQSGAAEWSSAVEAYNESLTEQCLLDCVPCEDAPEPTCEAGVCTVGG